MLLNVHSLSLAFGPKQLFDDTGFQVQPRDRVALVGPNGSGKTTLLRILNGFAEADSVQIEKPADATIGYLPQEGIVLSDRSVFEEVESAAGSVLKIRQQLEFTEAVIAQLAPEQPEYAEAVDRMGHLHHRLEDVEAHKLTTKIEKILFGLGFTAKDLPHSCSQFSGGWQMRIALAKLLLAEPDLLLLDEPTNHLDLDSLRWLESFLRNYEGTLLLISHDRAFLDALCSRILSLEAAQVVPYSGNYTSFLQQKAERQRQLEEARKSQDRKIAQTERFIERFRYKASKASQVQSRIKQLEKIERIELEQKSASIHFSFPPAPKSGHKVIELNSIRKTYGPKIVFDQFSLTIERGHRIGVVGINGAGKSTLARILGEREPFDSGERKEGTNCQIGYFAQDQAEELNPEATVLSIAEAHAVNCNPTTIRNVLGAFLFSGDDMDKRAKVLSGGEKNRLALARLLLRPANFIILDEPTNHLDMASKAILQEALAAFDGTLFIVSHDRDFLQPVVDRILEISPSGHRMFPGSLSDYLWKKDQEAANAHLSQSAGPDALSSKKEADNPKERRRQAALLREKSAPLRKQIQQAEAEIADLESRIAERETAMAQKAFFERGDQTASELKEYDEWKARLEAAMESWETASAKLEGLE